MQYLAILGRQPAISLAELTSLYPNQVERLHNQVALIDTDEVKFDRLGGTPKLAQVIAVMPTLDFSELVDLLAKQLPPHLPDKKVALGLSVYGALISNQTIWASSLELKKRLRSSGVSARVVPGHQMNAAQIQHNRMIDHGADIVIVSSATATYIGITRMFQNIESYGLRDHGRPARSAKVGMLPPKLAQIMINLANPQPNDTILDPFCGTGVVLQEALLMGFPAYGSDIEADLVAMSQRNLNWLPNQFGPVPSFMLEVDDATSHDWHKPIGAVVTEGYLGPALTSSPTADRLRDIKSDAADLTLKFFNNLRPQLAANTPVCITLPAWRQPKGFARLEVIDQITALGYTVKQFSPVQQADLLYARPDQFVGRELVVVRSR